MVYFTWLAKASFISKTSISATLSPMEEKKNIMLINFFGVFYKDNSQRQSFWLKWLGQLNLLWCGTLLAHSVRTHTTVTMATYPTKLTWSVAG